MQLLDKFSEQKWFSNLLRLLVICGIATPVGWLIVATIYRWQQHWSETYFLVVYLLSYVSIALSALLVRHQKSELPEFTLWGIAVFSGIGCGRVIWGLIQYEYHGIVHFSLRDVWLTMFGGVISLLLFYRWEIRKDRQQNRITAPRRKRETTFRKVVSNPVAAQFDEVNDW